MAVWAKDEYDGWTLTVRWLRAVVRPHNDQEWSWWLEGDNTGHRLDSLSVSLRRPTTLDAAKAAAEQALREMHDALAVHFAPVLRWERFIDDDGTRDVAVFGPLLLKAERFGWRVVRASDGHIVDFGIVGGNFGLPFDDGIKAARDRCEKSLRSLGVAFRTEGE